MSDSRLSVCEPGTTFPASSYAYDQTKPQKDWSFLTEDEDVILWFLKDPVEEDARGSLKLVRRFLTREEAAKTNIPTAPPLDGPSPSSTVIPFPLRKPAPGELIRRDPFGRISYVTPQAPAGSVDLSEVLALLRQIAAKIGV